MRIFLVLICLAALPAAAADKIQHILHPHRGQELFNGKDLTGWQWIGSGGDGFVVRDHLLETDRGKGILWYTGEKFGNAAIRVVYKMSNDKGNSGVFIRIPSPPKSEKDAINKGIEVQIDNRDNDWHCTGVLYSMTQALSRPYLPAGQWNTMDITLDGLRTIVRVNNSLVTSYDGVSPVPDKVKPYEPDRGPRPESGYIALQHHDNNAVFSFKEVSVRPFKK
ncbi:MAG TPA: DUF1080 domain-containing protein [Bryobacteraceae bacterium]|nr:DUF1080 domain-containing protein [Bryobacteraceae bacterium]